MENNAATADGSQEKEKRKFGSRDIALLAIGALFGFLSTTASNCISDFLRTREEHEELVRRLEVTASKLSRIHWLSEQFIEQWSSVFERIERAYIPVPVVLPFLRLDQLEDLITLETMLTHEARGWRVQRELGVITLLMKEFNALIDEMKTAHEKRPAKGARSSEDDSLYTQAFLKNSENLLSVSAGLKDLTAHALTDIFCGYSAEFTGVHNPARRYSIPLLWVRPGRVLTFDMVSKQAQIKMHDRSDSLIVWIEDCATLLCSLKTSNTQAYICSLNRYSVNIE